LSCRDQFREKVIAIRKSRRLTQEELAKLTGISRGTIMHIEIGNQRVFLDQALVLAKVLGFDLMEISFAPPENV
jgi:transcriptional regulator with XRE-family HTH domain